MMTRVFGNNNINNNNNNDKDNNNINNIDIRETRIVVIRCVRTRNLRSYDIMPDHVTFDVVLLSAENVIKHFASRV